MSKEIVAQLSLSKFIVARRRVGGSGVTLSYIGGKPDSMTNSCRLRREEILEKAFAIFEGFAAPVSLEYDVSRSAGITRITRGET